MSVMLLLGEKMPMGGLGFDPGTIETTRRQPPEAHLMLYTEGLQGRIGSC